MNGLRMFVRPGNADEISVFYSQRNHGPIYRWHYERHRAKWHVARVDASHWSAHELCTAPWQSLPQELKAKLSEHYVE